MKNAAVFIKRHVARLTIAVAFILSAPVWAGANRDVERANALYAAGKFEEAAEVYERLAQERPESPELQFNRGAAHYQLGDLSKAREAFEQAGVLSKDGGLQARSAYNLGNCAFKEGQEKVAQDPESAISSLNQSMGYYKDALSRDKSLEAAAHNLEMVKRTIQELRQQQEQQKQQAQEKEQKEQKEKEETKEKLDELIEEQQQQNQQSEQAAQQQQQQKQDPTQPGPTPEQMEAMEQQQEQTRDKTEDLAEQMPAPDESAPAPEPEAKSSATEAAEKQKEAEEHLKNQDAEAANKAQEEALEKLKEARKALDSEEKKEEQQPGEEQSTGNVKEQEDKKQEQKKPETSGEKPGDENKPENSLAADSPDDGVPPPDATAKDILNREKQNKEQRNLKRMIGSAPVEKDW